MKARISLMLDDGDDGETASFEVETPDGITTVNAIDCGCVIVDVPIDKKIVVIDK